MLAPSVFTPGNLPIITSANVVAPGEIPRLELLILFEVSTVEDLQLKKNVSTEISKILFIINFL